MLGDRGDPAPYHCDAVLLSLPRLFRTRLETIPAPRCPICARRRDAAQRWTRALAEMAGLKVGLVWAGNPEHVNDHPPLARSRRAAPLFDVPGTSFASLQVGPRAADLKTAQAQQIGDRRSVRPQLDDFAETAAAVDALDLVITVDTSVAHLAGALGKPVWVLLPWVTDWRWMLDREDNPWYPTMRLFRQTRGGGLDRRHRAHRGRACGGRARRSDARSRRSGRRRARAPRRPPPSSRRKPRAPSAPVPALAAGVACRPARR